MPAGVLLAGGTFGFAVARARPVDFFGAFFVRARAFVVFVRFAALFVLFDARACLARAELFFAIALR